MRAMDFSRLLNVLRYSLWIPLTPMLWNHQIVNIIGCFMVTIILSELIVLYLKTKSNPKLLDNLSSRAVLVTGCDTGIGHNLAKQLDGLGVTVYACCLFPDGQGAKTLKEQCSSHLHIVHLDVTNEEHLSSATKYVEDTLNGKKLWAIVNNAGIVFSGPIELSPMHDIKKIIDVNTVGTIAVTKSFLPLLRSSKGRVVAVSSPLGSFAVPMASSYCLTKAAVSSFCESLRDELRTVGISVHTILPASYETGINNVSTVEKKIEEVWKKSPEEIKMSYGEKFIRTMRNDTKLFGAFRNPPTKLSEVTNEIVAACLGCHPQNTYVTGSFASKVLLTLMITIPYSVQRIIKHPSLRRRGVSIAILMNNRKLLFGQGKIYNLVQLTLIIFIYCMFTSYIVWSLPYFHKI